MLRTPPRRPAPVAPVQAQRLSDRPVVAAGSVPGYGPIFNAGAIIHEGVYHLFARGVRAGYRPNPDHSYGQPRYLSYISDVLHFSSLDGIGYTFQDVLHASSPEAIVEDPRVQLVRSGGRERLLMSYTTVPALSTGKPWRAAISELTYAQGRFACGREVVLGPEGERNKDVVLANLADGRLALIERYERAQVPHQTIQLTTFASVEELWAAPPERWDAVVADLDAHTIIFPRAGARGVGAGAPPLWVEDELIFFFHERDGSNTYSTRVALLDGASGRVRSLLPHPFLAPALSWERYGDVDNVIFVQGAVLRSDGMIYLTYGAADNHVGAACVEAAPLLAALCAAG